MTPPVDETARAVGRFLNEVAAWGLPGARPMAVRVPARVAAPAIEGAREHRLLGLLGAAAEAGDVVLDDDLHAGLIARRDDALVRCLRLEVELLRVVRLLRAEGIEVVVLKGSAIAHLEAADPAWRTFADLDLLVRPTDLQRAVELLVSDGAARKWAERRPRFDARFAKSVTLEHHERIEVDLHRALCDGSFGFQAPLTVLHDEAVAWDLAGTTLRALSPVHRVLHTALHLVLGAPQPRRSNQRDLAENLLDPGHDRDQIVATAEAWGAQGVLAVAVSETLAALPVREASWQQWAEQAAPTGRDRGRIERQRRDGSGIGPARWDALKALPWRRRPAYGWALAAPSSAHLTSRGLRRRDVLRRRET